MKNILNLKIRRHESFWAFAPSVRSEAVPDWFEPDGEEPFMMQGYEIRETRRASIPAVIHVDGTGQLQTVDRETHPRCWLIEAFGDLTKLPLVLSTSLNENETVVCRASEALDCFLRTRIDVLVIGYYSCARTRVA